VARHQLAGSSRRVALGQQRSTLGLQLCHTWQQQLRRLLLLLALL
jgi:hypothetical protein